MGGASSKPPAPPKVAKKLGGAFAKTTVQLQHLPPVITKAAEEGILPAVLLRTGHALQSGPDARGQEQVAEAEAELLELAAAARQACNVRDYVTLLAELALLGQVFDAGPPAPEALDLARAVNPFLDRRAADDAPSDAKGKATAAVGEGSRAAQEGGLPEPLRPTDVALITEAEKDLLVLLYYCDAANLRSSPDEAVAQLAHVAEKHGRIADLDLRKESLTETEVYIHWSILYLTTRIATSLPNAALSPASQDLLEAERAVQLSRLLTVSEMLVKEARLDQAAQLLGHLRRCTTTAQSGWWRGRAKTLLKNFKRGRPERTTAHVLFAERGLAALAALKKAEDVDRERWWRRGGPAERSEVELADVSKLKGD